MKNKKKEKRKKREMKVLISYELYYKTEFLDTPVCNIVSI